jgi:MinD-like ATPase involved in chromosome partitioning or flagellar assembly
MIPDNISLFTWLDVEEVLVRLSQTEDWPNWLQYSRTYWDQLSLSIHPGKTKDAKKWLAGEFAPRFNEEKMEIELERDIDNEPRVLPVYLEETEEELGRLRVKPSFARPVAIRRTVQEDQPEYEIKPHVVAFHSFKGGVGRTVQALALAMALVENRKFKVLLIDGDLEAPGISWHFMERMRPPISYVDFLSLIHGDPDANATKSIKLAANRLRDALVNGIYIMPAFRNMDKFISLDIKPEHLVQGSKDKYILTRFLSRLGEELGVDFVIIDLRAGLSEISASLLLDPRVYRVLVTTLSAQSIKGTKLLLQLLARDAPSRRSDQPLPSVILSQVPGDYPTDALDVHKKEIQSDLENMWVPSDDSSNDEPTPICSVTAFDKDLAVLPESWDKAVGLIKKSRFSDDLAEILDWLPNVTQSVSGLEEKRRFLSEYANRIIYAEAGNIADYLRIRPLNRLVSEFSTRVPIAVVIGAKGSGKTLTFLQLARSKEWSRFGSDGSRNIQVNAVVVPVLKPAILEPEAMVLVNEAKNNSAKNLQLSTPFSWEDVYDDIRDRIQEDVHESKWRDYWLDYIAWSSGFEVKKPGAGRRFPDYLREKKLNVVAIIDGLENYFLKLSSDEKEQRAVRSLLQDVPNWLEQQVSRPLGILVFIRKDMVLNALPQNSSQFIAVYRNYELNWSSVEALRLFAWISMKAKALDSEKINLLQDMEKEQLAQMLIPLWGRKMGGENSREAITANWVIYALSDYNGQLQARDVVRFLSLASGKSIGSSLDDRVLVPQGMRKSLLPCSQQKVKDTGDENRDLALVFDKIKEISDDKKLIPFSRKDLEIESNDFEVLENNGVIRREGEEYYICEIFRWGLGFGLRNRARPGVIYDAEQAKKQRKKIP